MLMNLLANWLFVNDARLYVSVTKQYSLVLVEERWCPVWPERQLWAAQKVVTAYHHSPPSL